MRRIQNQIQLLSIHIPKTAGSSFQKTLETHFGEKAFQRLDFTVRNRGGNARLVATNRTSQELLDSIQSAGTLDPEIRVVHGHFRFEHFARFFEIRPDTKVVTWFREPVRRIVSNYNYLISILEQDLQHTSRSREAQARLLKSVVEFSAIPRDIGLYSDFLKGRELQDYDFIGITEDYSKELLRLGNILGCTDLHDFHVNKTRSNAVTPSAAEESEIARIQNRNIELYEQALLLASQGQ